MLHKNIILTGNCTSQFPLAHLNLCNFEVQWKTCLLQVTSVLRAEGNISSAFLKYEQNLDIDCNTFK